MRGALLLLAASGCVASESVVCMDGRTCPPKTACDEVHHLCVAPEQLTACDGLLEGQTCTVMEEPIGECHDNVCLTQSCGDLVTTHTEACDGETSKPAVGTCVDFNYDRGPLTCSALCTEGVDLCGYVGWRLRLFPAMGANSAMWEDGDVFWIANQNGIGRCDERECVIDTSSPRWHRGIWAKDGRVFAVTADGDVVRNNPDGTWTATQLVAPYPDHPPLLNAVWGRSVDDVYAVGADSRIFHFTGGTWRDETITGGTPNPLFAVFGSGTTVIAVGAANTIAINNGTGWGYLSTASINANLRGVWASDPTNMFIVGTDVSSGVGLIAHFNTFTRGIDRMPIPTTAPITAISGRSATEIYATTEAGEILFYDGAGWAMMEGPAFERLGSVSAGARHVYAGGNNDLLLEYANVGWVSSPTRPVSDGPLWGASLDAVFAIDGCTISRYNGSAWNTTNFPSCMPCSLSPVSGVTFWFDMFGTSATDVYAGGPYGALMHYDGNAWGCPVLPASVLPSGKPMWSRAIWGTANNIFVGGGSADGTIGYLVHGGGTQWQDWSDRIRPHLAFILGIWGSGPNDVYFIGPNIGGQGGAIVHYDGATFTKVMVSAPGPLEAIWGSGPTDVFVGGPGTMLHFDGATWSTAAIPIGTTLRTDGGAEDLHGTGPNDVYMVTGRALMHFDGTSWYPIRRPTFEAASRVQVIGGEVFVGGGDGNGVRLVGDPSP